MEPGRELLAEENDVWLDETAARIAVGDCARINMPCHKFATVLLLALDALGPGKYKLE